MSEITRIAQALKEKNSFLITAHDSPCGDAIASCLALGSVLKRMGKRVLLLNGGPPPPNLAFLPGAENIKTDPREGGPWEAAVVLDCANVNRLGRHRGILKDFNLVINIDHHVSNDFFGTLNYVDPGAASTGEQVFSVVKRLVDDITREEAICLYTTLVMDTGFFKYSNTSPKAHRLAALFLEKGVDANFVADEINGNFTPANRRLLGRALADIRISDCGRIASVRVTRKMLEEFGAHEDDAQDFIDYIQSLKGVKVSFCAREMTGNRIKVNFRSKTVDVDRLASAFGGGGHTRAAGCSLENEDIGAAEKKISDEIEKFLRD